MTTPDMSGIDLYNPMLECLAYEQAAVVAAAAPESEPEEIYQTDEEMAEEAWWDRALMQCHPQHGNDNTIIGQPFYNPEGNPLWAELHAELNVLVESGEHLAFCRMRHKIWTHPERHDLRFDLFQGIGKNFMVVPAVFWSSPVSFRRALFRIAFQYGLPSLDRTSWTFMLLSIAAHTATLRTKLFQKGEFVGWLPLDYLLAGDETLRRPAFSTLTGYFNVLRGFIRTILHFNNYNKYMDRWWPDGVNTTYIGHASKDIIFFHNTWSEEIIELQKMLSLRHGAAACHRLFQRGIRAKICENVLFAPVLGVQDGIVRVDAGAISTAYNACITSPAVHQCHEHREWVARSGLSLPEPSHPCARIIAKSEEVCRELGRPSRASTPEWSDASDASTPDPEVQHAAAMPAVQRPVVPWTEPMDPYAEPIEQAEALHTLADMAIWNRGMCGA